jgi:hypothetical protein
MQTVSQLSNEKGSLTLPFLLSNSPQLGQRKFRQTSSQAQNSLLYSRVSLANSWLSLNFSATLSAF